MLLTLSIVAALGLAGAAAAQTPNSETFKPGPENDPNNCSDLWRGIGLLPQYSREADRDAIIVCHTKYVLSHNNKDKTPDWVIEHLTATQISGKTSRPKVKFKPDPAVPRTSGRSTTTIATASPTAAIRRHPTISSTGANGWWRASSCPMSFRRSASPSTAASGKTLKITCATAASSMRGTLTITDTTNVCRNKIVLKPLKRESICGAKAKCEDGVTVPIALFKIIYHPRLHRANAFILPNINHRDADKGFAEPIEYLKRFQVTVQVVEKYTGLEFFRDLSLRSRRPILEQCTSFMEYWARRARPCAGPQRGAPLMRRVAPTHEVATAAVLGYRTGPAPFALSHASAPP
ncbi:MAG: DNA/RNA non-specific endonuclease [Pseudolabrys sp.]